MTPAYALVLRGGAGDQETARTSTSAACSRARRPAAAHGRLRLREAPRRELARTCWPSRTHTRLRAPTTLPVGPSTPCHRTTARVRSARVRAAHPVCWRSCGTVARTHISPAAAAGLKASRGSRATSGSQVCFLPTSGSAFQQALARSPLRLPAGLCRPWGNRPPSAAPKTPFRFLELCTCNYHLIGQEGTEALKIGLR